MKPSPVARGWRDIHEVAERRGYCLRTIRNWCRRGLRHAKIGGIIMIHDDDEDAFFNAHARGGNRDKNRVDIAAARECRVRGELQANPKAGE
jgi:hypothetical protein